MNGTRNAGGQAEEPPGDEAWASSRAGTLAPACIGRGMAPRDEGSMPRAISRPETQNERSSRSAVTRRLETDWTRCDGHGVCRALLPERIELDEWGFPILRDGAVSADPDELGAARRAVSACPALALRLIQT